MLIKGRALALNGLMCLVNPLSYIVPYFIILLCLTPDDKGECWPVFNGLIIFVQLLNFEHFCWISFFKVMDEADRILNMDFEKEVRHWIIRSSIMIITCAIIMIMIITCVSNQSYKITVKLRITFWFFNQRFD
jgi:hypothetical protein